MRQVWIPRPGPPEVLEVREEPAPEPEAGEVRIRAEACGINFGDVMGRQGVYGGFPELPVVPGYEVAGRVDAVGDGVSESWLGRDVHALMRSGGYAEAVCVPVAWAHPRPKGMDAVTGAALPVNYLAAHLLVERMGSLRPDETVLIHRAAGGVGVAAVQLARRIGARILGTASAAKHDFLKSAGVELCIDPATEDFEERVREHTDGQGVELVLDPVGGHSFTKSCRCLARTGRLGMYGMSEVAERKSRSWLGVLKAAWGTPWLRFTPPGLMRRTVGVFGMDLNGLLDEPERMGRWWETLLDYWREGAVRPVIGGTYPLGEAAEAHRALEERRNIGKVLLLP